MFKRLLAGVMASLMATTGCASPKEKRSMEFAEKYMQKYVAEMEEEMPDAWDDGELDLKVTYSSCSEEEAENVIDLDTDEPAKYSYYYTVDYTSDNIDDFYKSYKDSGYVNMFYHKMQDLKSAKIGVKSHHFWWGLSHFDRYDKKKNVETRIYVLNQSKEDPFIIFRKDHTHCYEIRSCDYGSFDLYVDGSMVYCYEKEHPDYGSVTNNNASSSSNTTSQKKYHSNSGSGSSSKHKYVYTDPYDAEDYNDADDFAEDWAEEFGDGDYDDGYDDAYDYWEDAMD